MLSRKKSFLTYTSLRNIPNGFSVLLRKIIPNPQRPSYNKNLSTRDAVPFCVQITPHHCTSRACLRAVPGACPLRTLPTGGLSPSLRSLPTAKPSLSLTFVPLPGNPSMSLQVLPLSPNGACVLVTLEPN